MHFRPFAFSALAAFAMVGCTSDSSNLAVSWYERAHLLQGPTGPDVIQMDVVVLETSLSNSFVNHDLWKLADEQFLPLERKKILAENGLKIGQISGITPADLQILLTSEKNNFNPRRKQIRAGVTTVVNLGPILDSCHFEVHRDGGKTGAPLEFIKVQCAIEITPTLESDGRTRLHCIPRLTYGTSSQLPGIRPESINWLARQQKPLEPLDYLAWDVVLSAGEYLIVGASFDRPDSFGYKTFIRPEEDAPVERVLVLRTARTSPDVVLENPEQLEALKKDPPLALQASWTITRSTPDAP